MLRDGISKRKLLNFAREYRTKGISDLKYHLSYCKKHGFIFNCDYKIFLKDALDTEIFKIEDFRSNKHCSEAEVVKESQSVSTFIENNDLTGANREAFIKLRIGQGTFRNHLIDVWGECCSVTKCGLVDILIASHIKPWKDSDIHEKVDPYNGLLLTPNLDKLFDRYLISFDNEGLILISETISKDDLKYLGVSRGMKLRTLTERHKLYLSHHRDRFHQKLEN